MKAFSWETQQKEALCNREINHPLVALSFLQIWHRLHFPEALHFRKFTTHPFSIHLLTCRAFSTQQGTYANFLLSHSTNSTLFLPSRKQTPKFDADSSHRFTTPKTSKSYGQHFGMSSLQFNQSKYAFLALYCRFG